MKRTTTIVVSVVVWGAIIFYIAWSAHLGSEKRDAVSVKQFVIHIDDSAKVDIIRAPMVEQWIRQAGLWPVGKKIDDIDTRAITETIQARDFVRDVATYVDLTGNVSVKITQRVPSMRFINDTGYDFYLTRDGYVVPVTKNSAHYVPVITGRFAPPFDKKFSGELEHHMDENKKKSAKNYIFLSKLINFVKYMDADDFWSSQIVQINVVDPPARSSRLMHEPEIELIPRVGDHVILLGTIDGYPVKLDRLMTFYREVVAREGWNNWHHINLKYDGQVVCSR